MSHHSPSEGVTCHIKDARASRIDLLDLHLSVVKTLEPVELLDLQLSVVKTFEPAG